ncbi:MAG: DMT family transporter [Fibrobacterota bacterium]
MLPYFSIFLTILLFSTIEIAVKLMPVGTIDANFLAALRFLIPGILMLIIQGRTFRRVAFRDYLPLCFIGAVGIGATFSAYHTVLAGTTRAEVVALVFSANPLFSMLFAAPLLKEDLKVSHLVAASAGVAGVYIVLNGISPIDPGAFRPFILLLFTAVSFGFYTSFSKKYILRYGTVFTTGIGFTIGGAVLLVAAKDYTLTPTLAGGLILGYLIFGATFIGYLCYFYGIKRLPVGAGASLFFLKPVIATGLSIFILKNALPGLNFYVGMSIIFIAIAGIILPRSRNAGTER